MQLLARKQVQHWLVLVCLSALLVASVRLPAAPRAPNLAFAALSAQAPSRLEASWDARRGIPTFLAGRDSLARLPYTPTAAEIGNPVAIARGFLDANRDLFRLRSVASELEVLRVEPDHQLGYAHVRLRQVHHGIPVFGQQLVVHLDRREEIVAVNGHFLPDLQVSTQPTISAGQAAAVALDHLLEQELEPTERARVTATVLPERTRLVVHVDDQDHATLTWQVTVMTQAPLGAWQVFVNARRPVVVHAYDNAKGAKVRRTFSADNTTEIPGRLVIEEGERSRDAIAQAAHDGAGTVYDYYFNTFKRDSLDGRGLPLVSTVHFGSDPSDADNAAWVGEAGQMIFGDGGRLFKPLVYGLDVIGHEFTHGVIDSTADLIYLGQSGALNESYADVFGALIDRGNWEIGEAVTNSPPYPVPYTRSLADPNARGNYRPQEPLRGVGQPAHMREFAQLPLTRRADNGGVHVNSGIPNHAAYRLAQAIGIDKTEQIYYRTLTQYLTPSSTFLDAARATVRAATDLYGEAEANAARQAFRDVGIDVDGSTPQPTTPPSTPPPTRGPTTPPTTPSLPAGCVDLITNGGFESDIGWTEVATNHSAIVDTELPHSGARSAWLGGTDKEPLQYVFQDVNVPANATTVQLVYFRLLHQESQGQQTGEARFQALIADLSGDVMGTIEQVRSSQGDDTWRERRGDLTQLAGKSIRLVFSSENPRGDISSYFVDDVALVDDPIESLPIMRPPAGRSPRAGGPPTYP